MTRENVEIVQRWIDAYNSRDVAALIELNEPEFEFRSIFVAVESVFRAPEGFPHAYFKTLDEAYESFVVVPSELIEAGPAVLMLATVEWRGKASGAGGETPIATAFWVSSAKVARAETFTDRAKAREAVGLLG
jgi:ketosteroid isomerase-like protein